MCRTALIQLPIVIAALSHARIAFLSGDEYGQVLLEVDSSYDHCTAPSPLAASAGSVSVRRTDFGLAVVSYTLDVVVVTPALGGEEARLNTNIGHYREQKSFV
ncbi:hypothetical protein PF003_g15465 [Phytophthora fragariae]|nr:hypothetical protein PF003_g15465 [Phytophthora fragariae]